MLTRECKCQVGCHIEFMGPGEYISPQALNRYTGERGCPMLEEIVPSRGSLSRVEGVRLMSGVVILTSRG